MSSKSVTPPTVGVLHQAAVPRAAEHILLDSLDQRMNAYLAVMGKGKSVDTAQGVLQQTNLWGIIKWVLSKEQGEFTVLYGRLLQIIDTNSDAAFSAAYAFRFFESLRLSVVDRRNFERMMNLLISTCNPRTRAMALKQIDLRRTLDGFIDNTIQQRVVAFYLV